MGRERERLREKDIYRYWETGEKDRGPGTGESKRESERDGGKVGERGGGGGRKSKREGVKLREVFKQRDQERLRSGRCRI